MTAPKRVMWERDADVGPVRATVYGKRWVLWGCGGADGSAGNLERALAASITEWRGRPSDAASSTLQDGA